MNFLEEIINQKNIEKMICKATQYSTELVNIKILSFSEHSSNFHDFKEYTVGKYNLCRLGDYDKSWLIDSNPKEVKNIKVKKICFLDYNILIRLVSYIDGKEIPDQHDFVNFLNYLKQNRFMILPSTAILEGIYDKTNRCIIKKQLEAFEKYIQSHVLDENTKSYKLTKEDNDEIEKYIKEISDLINDVLVNKRLDALKCMLFKAFILKYRKKDKYPIDEFVKFCINELKMFDITDIYALCQFFKNSEKNYFSKLQLNRSNLSATINNVAWDLYHPRLALDFVNNDINYKENQISLPYFATNDLELNNFIKLNPSKFIIFQKYNSPYSVPTNNADSIFELINDKNICNEIVNPQKVEERAEDVNRVDFANKKILLEREASKLQVL